MQMMLANLQTLPPDFGKKKNKSFFFCNFEEIFLQKLLQFEKRSAILFRSGKIERRSRKVTVKADVTYSVIG